MKTVIQNRFDGGIAEDIRTTNTNECEISTNFDIFSNPHKAIHFRDQLPDTGSNVDDMEISDVGMTTISGTSYMVAFGYDTSSTTLAAAYARTAYDFNGSWSQQAVGPGGYTYIKGTYIQYGGISFVLARNSTTTWNLLKYTGAGSLTSISTFTALNTTKAPRPYIHPDDKILYIVVGTTIAKYDIATNTFNSYTTILPTGYIGTSITHWGGYLAIAMVPELAGDSIVYLWGRNTAITTLQGVVNFGSRFLQTIENIEGSIVGISTGSAFTTSLNLEKKIEVRVYQGGENSTLVKSVSIPSSSTTNYNLAKAKKDEKLYFAVGGESAIYCVGKNKAGRWTITQDRAIVSGSSVVNVTAINFVGDYCYIASNDNGTYKLTGTDVESSVPYANTAVYKTTINPSMPVEDREKDKRLISIRVVIEGRYANGTSVLKYSVNGSAMSTIQSLSNSVGTTLVLEASADTNGSPFENGKEYQFQIETTYGADIKEIGYKYETFIQSI